MSTNPASQLERLKDLDVRKATNSDAANIIAAVAEGHKASIRPLFLDALKKGIGIHLRSFVFAGIGCAFGAYLGFKDPEQLVVAGTLGWAATWCLLLIYIWIQMMKELTTAATGDLTDIEKHFLSDQKGSSFWVVVRVADSAAGAGSQVSQGQQEQVVGCVGLRATSRGDAHLSHLAVLPREQGHGVGSTLLKHVIKHAKAKGLQMLTATCTSAQPAALRVLHKLGFKEVLSTPVHKWFTVYTLRLALADKQQ